MIVRYFSSVSLGMLVASGLLWLMQCLIDIGPEVLLEPQRRVPTAWRVGRKPEVIEREAPPARVPPPDYRPPVDGEGAIGVDPPTAPGPVAPERGWDGPRLTMTDGPLVAIMNVQSAYPGQAAGRGLEGHVVVQFDVGPAGRVINVVVLEASHRVFERPAIEAALRSRYRPRVVDGVAVKTTAVRMLY